MLGSVTDEVELSGQRIGQQSRHDFSSGAAGILAATKTEICNL